MKKPSWRAASAVDGRLRTISHTCASRRPWWYVDLGTNMWIHSVKVVNSGTDLCRDCWDRINPFEVGLRLTRYFSVRVGGVVLYDWDYFQRS